MNNLTVDGGSASSRHLKPRKSVIGKLERSSFQAQRLSDVGIAFSQQITAKVGLKLPASQERIVEQTRWLYLRYVFVKLRQNKLPLKDLNLTKSSRARRAAVLGASNEAQITVSISEPPSADALTMSDQRPLFTSNNSRLNTNIMKKRSALTTDIDQHDLSLLAARINTKRNTLKYQRDCVEQDAHDLSDTESETNIVSSTCCSPNLNRTASQPLASRLTSAAINFSTSRLSGRLSYSSKSEPSAKIGGKANIVSDAATPTATLQATASSKKYLMDPTINNQIFTVITNMIRQLRETKPEIYGDTIYEMIGLDKFSSLDGLLDVQKTLCQEMTRSDISWDRIVAMFSLFGAMSLDCVRLGAPEHVGPILDGFIGFVERDLALWISQQGGWESFLYKFRASYRYGTIYKMTAISVPLLIFWAFVFTYNNSISMNDSQH